MIIEHDGEFVPAHLVVVVVFDVGATLELVQSSHFDVVVVLLVGATDELVQSSHLLVVVVLLVGATDELVQSSHLLVVVVVVVVGLTNADVVVVQSMNVREAFKH